MRAARRSTTLAPGTGPVVGDHQDETRNHEPGLVPELQRLYADALLAGDPWAAERAIREAIEAGLDETTIDDRVIAPALVLVGDLWADGSISVADEHLATSISMRVMTLQREAFRVARERASRCILLAGAQGEHHVVGLEMAASAMLRAGYDVRMLGADVPVSAIRPAVARHRPAVVGFTTATSLSAVNLPAAVAAVHSVDPDAAILLGGRGVDDGLAALPDVLVCRHVADAVAHVDALVRRAGRN
jgi:MerR family transcriptional regulator, light-induced transcriptional regulator